MGAPLKKAKKDGFDMTDREHDNSRLWCSSLEFLENIQSFPSREVVAFFAARKKPPLPSKIDSPLLLPPSRLVIIFLLLLRSSSYLRISLLSYSRDGSRRGGKEGFFVTLGCEIRAASAFSIREIQKHFREFRLFYFFSLR